MKVRFLQDGESPDFGAYKKGQVIDLPPDAERLLIERGVGELSSIEDGYRSKKKKGAKGDGGE
jgi:hypothetical protein